MRIAIGMLVITPASVLEIAPGRRDLLRVLMALAATAAYVAYCWAIERRLPRELSPRRALVEWIAGFGLGAFVLGATISILWALHAYAIEGGGSVHALSRGLTDHVPGALVEELLFRALVFKVTEESLGSSAALAIQAALFGAVHLGNPGASAGGTVAIALEAGILLGAAFMLTRRVWFAWGIHAGWNYTQGSVFGIRVSGVPASSSWLHSRSVGQEALTGGAFGVEASPIAVVVCLGAAVVILWFAAKRGQIVTWRAQRARLRELRAA